MDLIFKDSDEALLAELVVILWAFDDRPVLLTTQASCRGHIEGSDDMTRSGKEIKLSIKLSLNVHKSEPPFKLQSSSQRDSAATWPPESVSAR
jgi:hypothetical protein